MSLATLLESERRKLEEKRRVFNEQSGGFYPEQYLNSQLTSDQRQELELLLEQFLLTTAQDLLAINNQSNQ